MAPKRMRDLDFLSSYDFTVFSYSRLQGGLFLYFGQEIDIFPDY